MQSSTAENLQTAEIVIPGEWAPHKAIWTAWPSHKAIWKDNIDLARTHVAGMVKALSGGDKVRVLAMGPEAVESAKAAIGDVAEIIPMPFGDIWMRDVGPIFASHQGRKVALRFKVNGWGGKFDEPLDHSIGDSIATLSDTQARRNDFILEGGSVDHDGEGTVLTTRQCILNANRNKFTEEQAEAQLKKALGAKKIIWIERGLNMDHTDGHVDNIARFVAPGKVVCQSPFGDDDPNAEILNEIAATLEAAVDAKGRKLEVFRVPSPGRVLNPAGEVMPASHMNFLIGNKVVVVPVYGTASEKAALDGLQALFPGREVIGLPGFGILTGGGCFHCITQQEPA